ncbi:MAG: GAF domain-containing protein [Nocardioidaceae bacterium]
MPSLAAEAAENADGRVANEGWSGSGPPAHPTFPVTQGLNGHAIRAGSLALSNDVSRDPRYLTNQEDTGSELIVPVFLAGRVVGTLDAESANIGAFGSQAILWYATVAPALQPLWESTG